MAKYILISLFILCSVSFGKVLTQDTGKIHITNIETNAFRALPQHSRHVYDDIALENRRANHREPSEKDKLYFIEPGAVTNSHKPQYYEETNAEAVPEKAESENKNLVRKIVITQTQTPQIIKKDDTPELNNETVMEEALVEDLNIDEEEYKPSNHLRNKQNQIKAILVKILEKSDQKRKFAEVLPILKVMTPVQRLTMASLVSKQLTSDSRNPPLNLAQVKAMFGNNPNVTAELMLPIMLDIANMFRAAKDQQKLHTEKAPQAQLLRRSFSGDEDMDPVIEQSSKALVQLGERVDERITTQKPMKIAAKLSSILKNTSMNLENHNNAEDKENNTISDDDYDTISSTDTPETFVYAAEIINGSLVIHDNSSLLGNNTGYLSEDLPTAEKLRALNRYIDRNGNLVVLARPPWIHGVSGNTMSRRKVGEQTTDRLSQRRKIPPVSRQTLLEMAKQKCELFTNSLCLDSLDYPVEAISNSIRRNQAAMGALLADFPEVSADSAIDGVSSKQENMYTPEHYMNSLNRREDGVTSPVGAAGFMCPSTVKYARPQKARATSGQWKYIVNTGEHTQTLRLEKCLRPREPCTYLTDNFKSKCVQVYNYHRLLTWDQHNGLHMDIFKVPTCCSCHIEGYSVSFPPHVHRPAESTSEQFPGEDLSHDQDVNPYENVQPSTRHSIRTSTFSISPPVDSFPALGDNQNFISGSSFVRPLYKDDDPGLHDLKHLPVSNQFDSINSNFHTDIFQQQGTNIRSIKKPNPIRGATGGSGLPSFLEPPSKPPGPVLNTYLKSPDVPTKYKPFINSHFKRGASGTQLPNKRPNRRPIRKKTSNVSGDQLVGASNVHENPTIINMESFEDINDSMEFYENSSPKMPPVMTTRSSTPKTRQLSTSKFTIKNVSPTTERYYPKSTPVDHGSAILKDIALNRRVNYNYHPIIDFFEGGSKKETDVASDRIDSESLFLEGQDSDWRPMPGHVALPLKSGPPSTASPNKNM